MRLLQPHNLFLPLALVAITAPGIGFLGSFWLTGRWPILALLALYTVLFSVSSSRASVPTLRISLIAYIVWCVLTYGWSLVPDLSLLKIIALLMVVFACFRGGYRWVEEHSPQHGLEFLWPITLIAIPALFAGGAETAYEVGSSIVIYSGATGNPNFLGFIMAMATPVVFVNLHRDWGNIQRRTLLTLLLLLCVYGLYQSGSRSSYLLFVSIACGVLASQGAGRIVLVPVLFAIVAGIASVAAPYFTDRIVQRSIYKDTESGDVFFSRQGPWEESYEAAKEGGVIGLGYGVTYGAYDFSPGLTAVNYGREKGNTQMAVVEETGLVGLALYLVLIASLFREILTGYARARTQGYRTMLGIVIGTLFGLTVHSVFEAWWVAPGSVEFGTFWAIAGAGCAIARAARDQAENLVSSQAAARAELG